MKKYAVLNPMTGTYEYADTENDAESLPANIALDLYINNHCHGNPFSIVTVNDDNSETWQSYTGDIILSPKQLEDALKSNTSRITGIKKTVI